jgi:hypothetical protein
MFALWTRDHLYSNGPGSLLEENMIFFSTPQAHASLSSCQPMFISVRKQPLKSSLLENWEGEGGTTNI